MNKRKHALWVVGLFICALTVPLHGQAYVWQMQEITFRTSRTYENPYTDVVMWVDLEGPQFSKRIYGYWDGGQIFKVRLVATAPGQWTWTSASNQPDDTGLNAKTGQFQAVDWTEQQKRDNPNRRGFIRATTNGHALQYADGTPFFLVGDTWWAASTWRLPFAGKHPDPCVEPGPGMTFEDLLVYRKRQGYNSINIIAAFPNWAVDHQARMFTDKNGVTIRSAWHKWGSWSADGGVAAKDMHDEQGNRPFEMMADHEALANFDRINPSYFRSLDKKMKYLSDQGFVPMLETVRRDHGPSWKAYFDFTPSFARYVQYIISRYGAFNLIFSGIHLDAIPKKDSLTAQEFNAALTYHYKTYGPLPFGQPYTTLISWSTYQRFGHGDSCPWLTMHSVGNKDARDHGISPEIERLFRLDPPYPAINLEPYYTGWTNKPGGERPPVNSARDNYFSRAMMYLCVLSGALAGHVHGHAAYDCTTTGEPVGVRPYIWEALRFDSGTYMQHLRNFVLSEGRRYQDLIPASDSIVPRKAPDSKNKGLDGWSYMMRTPEKELALLYFENGAVRATLSRMKPNALYQLTWFDPRAGQWLSSISLKADVQGNVIMPAFPGGHDKAGTDWAAKLKTVEHVSSNTPN